MADLTQISDADLNALASGDLTKVSDGGLAHLAGQSLASPQSNQSWGTLPANATNKMLAGTADSILNTPNNLLNLGKAGIGSLAIASGHPEYAPETSPNPDFVTKLANKLGLIENKPMTPIQQVADKAIQAGGAMLMNPANGVKQALGNVATGAAAAGAGSVVGQVTGSPALEIATNIAVPAGVGGLVNRSANNAANQAMMQSRNAQRDTTLAEGRDAGYVIPPSEVDSSFLKDKLEGFGGKAAIKQQATAQNQDVTNTLARQALNIPDKQPLSINTLEAKRAVYAQPYQEVANLSPQASKDLEALKQARNDANGWYAAYNRSASPDDLAKAKQFQNTANGLEASLSSAAIAGGRPDLPAALTQARKEIAKTYTVQRALNDATGDVSAPVIGRIYSKGNPLSDGLDTIGKFNAAFPKFTSPGVKNPAPGVSKVEAITSLMMGGGGALLTGNPLGAVAGVIPYLSDPARSLLLSKAFQTPPKYNTNSKLANLLGSANTGTVQGSNSALAMRQLIDQLRQ